MIAIITAIKDSKVYAKSVNPLGELNKGGWYYHTGGYLSFDAYKDKWQQAESDRVELPLHEDCLKNSENSNAFYYRKTLKLICYHDTIEVTQEGNFFKII